jgi:hypothetical protein
MAEGYYKEIKVYIATLLTQREEAVRKDEQARIYNAMQKSANKYMLDPLFPQVKFAITEILFSVIPESKRTASLKERNL